MSRTLIYIDGFNLYYRALKGSGHKWLNIAALAQAVLPKTSQVVGINYYTARISGRTDAHAPARQHAYLRALESLPQTKRDARAQAFNAWDRVSCAPMMAFLSA